MYAPRFSKSPCVSKSPLIPIMRSPSFVMVPSLMSSPSSKYMVTFCGLKVCPAGMVMTPVAIGVGWPDRSAPWKVHDATAGPFVKVAPLMIMSVVIWKLPEFVGPFDMFPPNLNSPLFALMVPPSTLICPFVPFSK